MCKKKGKRIMLERMSEEEIKQVNGGSVASTILKAILIGITVPVGPIMPLPIKK